LHLLFLLTEKCRPTLKTLVKFPFRTLHDTKTNGSAEAAEETITAQDEIAVDGDGQNERGDTSKTVANKQISFTS
jgi:hypothetical protein